MSFLGTLADNFRSYPDKIALEFLDTPRQRVTYSELESLLRATENYLLALGFQSGDRVALQLTKSLEFIVLNLATLRLGGISLPLNTAYPPDEIEYFLSDSGARFLFALKSNEDKVKSILQRLPNLEQSIFLDTNEPNSFRALLASHSIEGSVSAKGPEPGQINRDDTAVIIYTSGTTGQPKGAQITHGNLDSNLEALHTSWGWQPEDVLLHVLPIFHVHGLFVALFGVLYAGATALILREFDPKKTLQALVDNQCSVFMAVPTIHRRLVNSPDANHFDLSHLRLITSGSDRLPDEVFTGFQKTFGYTLIERYGMSETGMNTTNPLNGERRLGSVGKPLPGVEVRIADATSGGQLPGGQVGEVQLRGDNIFKGYWNQPQKTSQAYTPDGWFRTGDLGFLSEDGYLTLVGREKDLIISGGMNVYPPEVERVLNGHPDVAVSAVIGCEDKDWGERVTAIVVFTTGQHATAEELITFCRARLAPYKTPKVILFRDSLPMNAMGKVSKQELRNQICAPE
jgi:malonyl-CoA/methylmalonyl-CoA synthetase